MRVLYVIDSLARGGAESSLVAMAPRLIDRGVELDVGYLKEVDGLRDDLIAAGATVISLAGQTGDVPRARQLVSLRGLIAERRPHLVHTTLFESDILGRPAARLAGVRVVSSLVNEAYGPEHRSDPRITPWKLRVAQTLDASTARFAVRMHAVSARVADVMSARLRYPRERIDVIPRGRSSAALGERSLSRRQQVRRRHGLSLDSPVVLAVARHEYQKGLDTLLHAMPSVRTAFPTVQLLVAGREGAESSHLRRIIEDSALGDIVTILGPRDDVPDLLSAADVFVLPSRREGFPGSVLEAMALGVPVVATDLPTTREAVGRESALLVPVDSVEELASALDRSLSERAFARARAERALARFRSEFAIESVADRMVDFYAAVLRERR